MKGCPLRCIWCHNPESQENRHEIMFEAKKCIECGMCKIVIASASVAISEGDSGNAHYAFPLEQTLRVGSRTEILRISFGIPTLFARKNPPC